MNAPARIAARETHDVRDRIADLAGHHGNPEAGREAAALAADANGRAAFWTTAHYHNAAACLFLLAANDVGLDLALAFHADPTHPMKTRSALLATLLPLNRAAAVALAAASPPMSDRAPAADPLRRALLPCASLATTVKSAMR